MTFEEYQKAAVSFRTETADNGEYLLLGLLQKSAKRLVYWVALLLDGDTDQLEYIVIEVGSLAKKRNYTLEQVAEINIAKLRDRQARGVIKGNGDER